MSDTVPTAGWEEFYSNLAAAINAQVVPLYGQPITLIQLPSQGQFLWFYQNLNLIFNQGTFDYISARVAPANIAGMAQFSASGGLPNAYIQLLSSLTYSLSQADQIAITNALNNAAGQAMTMVSDYQTTFGQITPAQLQVAQQVCGAPVVQGLQDYVIAYVLGFLWSGAQENRQPPLTYQDMAAAASLPALLPAAPSAGTQVVNDVVRYLALLEPVTTLQTQQQLGNWSISQLMANCSSPDSANGGMRTVNPNTGALMPSNQVGYAIGATTGAIQSNLTDASRTITVTVAMPQSLAKATGVSSVTVEYPGHTMVPIAPTAWNPQSGSGWYDPSVLAEANANGSDSVTGYRFLIAPSFNLGPFANGGDFGVIAGLLISQQPVVTLNSPPARTLVGRDGWPGAIDEMLEFVGLTLPALYPGPSGQRQALATEVSVSTLMQSAFVIGGCIANPSAQPTSSGLAVMLTRRLASAPTGPAHCSRAI